MAEKYFKKALEGTRLDCDFSEDESPSKEELRDREEDEELYSLERLIESVFDVCEVCENVTVRKCDVVE